MIELKSTGRYQALKRGLARAAQFTWERTAQETVAVYERVGGGGQ